MAPPKPPEPFSIGDVDGKNGVTMTDALEILKYLAKMHSALDDGIGSSAWNAALITVKSRNDNKPAIADALEILKKLAKMDNEIDRYNNSFVD